MKILLYFEGENFLSKSGIGRAFQHQKEILKLMNIDFTLDSNCEDYDILHINTYGISSTLMIQKALSQHKKIIIHAHSTEEDFKDSYLLSNQVAPFVKKHLVSLFAKADALITPTLYAKTLIENYGVKTPIYPISNGVDLKRFAYDAEKVRAFKNYFQIQPHEKVIISVGLYLERKGILDFFEVAKRLPEYKFIWFGYSNPLVLPLHVQKALLNVPKNVVLPGYIKGGILEGAYLACDCFFFPTHEETEGIVVLEALASKQNVLIRDIPVYADWMQNGVNCYKGKSVDEFTTLLKQIITGQLPPTKEKAYELARQYSFENIGKRLVEVYEKVENDEKIHD